jgi:hypothetical protein
MRRKLMIALAAGLSVAGCGDQGQQQANRTEIKVRGPDQDRLHQLDAFNLAIALKRAIYDAGYTCKRITDGGYVGTYKNLDMWMAHCTYESGAARDWAVFTGPDGSAQVRDCKDITPDSGLPTCKIQRRPTGSFNTMPTSTPAPADLEENSAG